MLEQGERLIIEDIEKIPLFVGTRALEVLREAGVRGVQSTPLVSRSGRMLGILSTHYRRPLRPDDRDLRWIDLLARQSADLLDQHQTEQALRQNDRLLANTQRVGCIGSWEWDLSSGEVRWSRQLYDIYGVDPDTFVPSVQAFRSVVHPDDRQRIEEEIHRAVTTGGPVEVEFRIVTPTGAIRTLLSKGELVGTDRDGTPREMLGVEQDITKRKQAEVALTAQQLQFRAICQHAPLGIALSDIEGRVTLANPVFCRLVGYDNQELIGRNFRDFTVDGDLAVENALVEELLDGRRESYELEKRYVRKDGRTVWVRIFTALLRDSSGRPAFGLAMVQDITARKEDEAVRNSEARLRALMENAPDAIFAQRQGRIVWANPAAVQLCGAKTAEELLGTAVLDRIAPEYHELVRSRIEGHLKTNRSVQQTELEIIQLDGTRVPVDGTAAPVPFIGGTEHLVILRDTSVRKRAEAERAALREQLFHSQKMEAVGTLASGVAHDFNNVLSGILAGLSVLEFQLAGIDEEDRERIQDMKSLVQRGARLSSQLLGFSRRGKYAVAPRDLRAIAHKTAAMFGRTRHDITIEMGVMPDLAWGLVDDAQFEQVLLNLFINAAHAMPRGGKIAVHGENAALTTSETEPYGVKPGRFVRLVVSDTGMGIPKAMLPRIFEPFFTTKPAGQGTGLGLASVYGIVRNHGGIITVESEIDRGTTFTILLPATERPSSGNPEKASAVQRGTGTILLVDDEELVLKFSTGLLRAMGFEVLTAAGGRSAVELVRLHRDRISLVILDMTMPEMSGPDTFDAIRSISPTMRVLLASGYSVEGQAQMLLDRGCNGFIQKPFDAIALAEKIRAIQ